MNPKKDEIWNKLCLIYLMKLDYDNAIWSCTEALLINPKNGYAWYYLGMVYYLIRDRWSNEFAWTHIKLPFQEKTYYDRKLSIAKCQLSYAYFENKHHNKAIEICNEVILADPLLKMALALLSHIYNDISEYDKAIDACNRALKIDPKYGKTWNKLCWAYYDKGEYDRAINACNRALEIDPNDKVAWNNLGSIYNNKGEYDKVIYVCNRALEIDPEYSKPMNHLGFAYYKKGNYGKAIELIKHSIELDPDYELAKEHLNQIYQELGVELVSERKPRLDEEFPPEPDLKSKYRAYDLYVLAKYLYKHPKNYPKAQEACNLSLEINPLFKKVLNLKKRIEKKINR